MKDNIYLEVRNFAVYSKQVAHLKRELRNAQKRARAAEEELFSALVRNEITGLLKIDFTSVQKCYPELFEIKDTDDKKPEKRPYKGTAIKRTDEKAR